MTVKITITNQNFDHVVFLHDTRAEDVSRTIRGALEKGYYHVNGDDCVYIGPDLIATSIFEIENV